MKKLAATIFLGLTALTLFFLQRKNEKIEVPKSEEPKLEFLKMLGAGAKPPQITANAEQTALSNSCWEKINSQLTSNKFEHFLRGGLDSYVGAWFFSEIDGEKARSPDTKEGKFLFALAKAQLLEGSKLEKNEDEAIMLLEEVIQLDPKNSAPLLFAAIIESNRGNQAKANRFLQLAQPTDHFNSYITDVSKFIFSQVRSPEDLVESYEIWSQLPVPRIVALKEFLQTRGGKKFAHQMVEQGLNDKALLLDMEWFPLEYAVGRSVLVHLEPKKTLPTYQEVLQRKHKLQPLNGEQVYEHLQKNCDVSPLLPVVDFFQNRFSKIK